MATELDRSARIVGAMPLGVAVFRVERDGTWVCAEANPAVERLLGPVRVGGWAGRTLDALVPDLAARVRDVSRRATAGAPPVELGEVDRDDPPRWARVAVSALGDGSFALWAEDATRDRRLARRAELLETLVARAPAGVVLLRLEDPGDPESLRVVETNAVAVRMLPEIATWVGRRIGEVSPETVHSGRAAVYAEVARTETPREVGLVDMARGDGARATFLVHALPLPDAMVAVTFMDVSERSRAEERLQQSEARLRAILDAAPDAILTVGPAGRVMFASAGAEQVFRRAAGTMVGERLTALIEGGGPAVLVAARGGPVAVEGVRPDGSRVPLHVTAREIETERGHGYTVIARDMTEFARIQRELREHAERLARSNQELERFAYVASHDLQEPLRMVAGFTELLARRYGDRLDEDARVYIRFATDGARRMQLLIRELLEYSRVGAQGWITRPVEAREVLERVLGDLGASIEQSGARVDVGDLPTVMADPVLLARVLHNLLTNALKFHGAERPVIHVEGAREGANAVLTVRDEGIGFPPHHAERVFEVFRRLHPVDRFPGSGMGLAIAKKVVEGMGGRIWAEGSPGRGAAFHVSLPSPEDTSEM